MIFFFKLFGKKFKFLLVFIVGWVKIIFCILFFFKAVIVIIMVKKVFFVFVGFILKMMLWVLIVLIYFFWLIFLIWMVWLWWFFIIFFLYMVINVFKFLVLVIFKVEMIFGVCILMFCWINVCSVFNMEVINFIFDDLLINWIILLWLLIVMWVFFFKNLICLLCVFKSMCVLLELVSINFKDFDWLFVKKCLFFLLYSFL